MPDPVACSHPLHAPRRQHAFVPGRLCVAHGSLEHNRHRCDPGVPVPSEAHWRGCKSAVEGGEVQENEGLDDFAQVRWTHQSSDGPLFVSPRAVDDFTDRILNLTGQHDYLSEVCAFAYSPVTRLRWTRFSTAQSQLSPSQSCDRRIAWRPAPFPVPSTGRPEPSDQSGELPGR